MKTPTTPAAADLPPTVWGKILAATPVVMTVVATMLAGLASSEMTRAQYDRSLAAQLQSKAGDQWSFFQAKKLRSAMQRSTLDGITTTVETHRLDAGMLGKALGDDAAKSAVDSPSGRAALDVLQGGALPQPPAADPVDPKVGAALKALEESRPDDELNALVRDLDDAVLEKTLRAARARALALDELTNPLSKSVDAIEAALTRNGSAVEMRRDFTAARLGYNAQRYDVEARHNQSIALLYELQVRKNNLTAERHHKRSGRFFFGMLAAQTAVIFSSFAMAARKRSILWSIAAVAGMAAIAFAVYVYLYV